MSGRPDTCAVALEMSKTNLTQSNDAAEVSKNCTTGKVKY